MRDFDQSAAAVDPEVAAVLEAELARQRGTLEMIASENFVPRAVLEAQGSVLTNKYAEGYPGRRYYGGCEEVDKVETLAIERAKSLFNAEYANVQPHSGAQANAAVYHALLSHGDTVMGLQLAHGGHLTHGMKINFSGKNYDIAAYGLNPETHRIDMDMVREQALAARPKMIIAGWSAYPRRLDFEAFRQIADEVGAFLWTVVTTTIHKTLGGPRSGMILSRDSSAYAKKLNSAVFPGQQGGPLMHVVAAKAVALRIAATEAFKDRQARTVEGAKILAERLNAPDVAAAGVGLVTGGTDVHLVLVDLRNSDMDGQQAEDLLDDVGITVNRNAVPWDPRPAAVTSGLRIGTPALATRGFGAAQFEEVADILAAALIAGRGADIEALRGRVKRLTDEFPLYEGLEQVRK